MTLHPEFQNHAIVAQSPQDYDKKTLSPRKILNLWSSSMFAHELLNKDKTIKTVADMTSETKNKFEHAMTHIQSNTPIDIPIIGIGMLDGIEIGVGREIIAACQTLGIETMPVYVRKSQHDEIKILFGE